MKIRNPRNNKMINKKKCGKKINKSPRGKNFLVGFSFLSFFLFFCSFLLFSFSVRNHVVTSLIQSNEGKFFR